MKYYSYDPSRCIASICSRTALAAWRPLLAWAVFAGLWVAVEGACFAQSLGAPSSGAPTRPAPLPPARRPASNVVSLPPPPSGDTPVARYAAGQLLPPPVEGESSTAKVPANNVSVAIPPPIPNSLYPTDSLVPDNAMGTLPFPNGNGAGQSGTRLTPDYPSLSPGSLPGFASPPTMGGQFTSGFPGAALPGIDGTSEPAPTAFQAGELIAVVGTEHVLAGDMIVFVEPIIEANRSKIRGEDQEQALRAQLTRQALKQYIEVKAMYQEFFYNLAGNKPPKEQEQARQQVLPKARKIFHERQVPELMKKYDAKDYRELEEKLREKSLSLLTVESQFIETVLAGQFEMQSVPDTFEIDPAEILQHYREHRDDWNVPARARWRQLTVRFDKHDTRQEAEQLIRRMGDEIFLGGKSFEAVAKQSSEGFTAAQGGLHDWTNQGSLKSQPIDAAMFSIPLNRLSQIIEDDVGFHIIEVVEREPQKTKALAESQAEIRDKLSDAKRKTALEELRKSVMERTSVWTRWPEDIPGSRPLSEALGELP